MEQFHLRLIAGKVQRVLPAVPLAHPEALCLYSIAGDSNASHPIRGFLYNHSLDFVTCEAPAEGLVPVLKCLALERRNSIPAFNVLPTES
jgi:hypothetical protein